MARELPIRMHTYTYTYIYSVLDDPVVDNEMKRKLSLSLELFARDQPLAVGLPSINKVDDDGVTRNGNKRRAAGKIARWYYRHVRSRIDEKITIKRKVFDQKDVEIAEWNSYEPMHICRSH